MSITTKVFAVLAVVVSLIAIIGSLCHAYAKELPLTEQSDCWECVLTIIGEAVGESFEGQVAVGEVIRNRSKKRGMSYRTVVQQPNQFSFWNNKTRATEFISVHKHKVDKAQSAWRRSQFTNYTKGSTHYYSTIISEPWWAKHMTFTVQLGKHRFFRED